MSGDDIRDIQDPLFARVDRADRTRSARSERSGGNGRETPPANPPPTPNGGGSSALKWVGAVVLVAVLAGMGYYLYLAQQRIENLQTDLVASRETLASENQAAQERIVELNEALSNSRQKIEVQQNELGRAKGQVANLKQETETLKSTQEEQSRNLEAINLQKADKSQVASLEGRTDQIAGQVDEAKAGISDLRTATSKNRADIDSNKSDITTVGGRVEDTAGDLSNFKSSLARETYNFELQKKGAVMKLLDVSLDLKGTNVKRQRYELEIIVEGRKIKRKNHVNEPIRFYVEGSDKAYEVVVTKVGKDFVVGHLNVPKERSSAQGNASVSG